MDASSSEARDEIENLRERLANAEETLRAIREGEVDALVVDQRGEPAVFTLKTAAEPYRQLVEQMAQGALTVQTDGLILFCNSSFARIVERPRERVIGTLLQSYIAPGGEAALGMLLTSEPGPPQEIAFRQPGGLRVDTYVAAAPLAVDGRDVLCLTVTDLSQQRLRLRYSAIVESSSDAIYALDEKLTIQTWNRGAEELTGLTPDQAIGRNERELWPEAERTRFDRLLETVTAEGGTASLEQQRWSADGSRIEAIYSLTPLTDIFGRPSGYSVVAHDITERKQAEKHRELLIHELNHRVKNTLAIVQGLAQQTFKGTDGASEARTAFQSRLAALATAHNLLTRSNWESASLEDLARETVEATCGEEERIRLDGPMIVLQPKQAVTVGMALHELCTNAVKYGALSVPEGTIKLSWNVTAGAEPRLGIVWRERGGPRVEPPARRGFGSRMVEQALAHELDGEVTMDFRPEGLHCTIDAALPQPPGRDLTA